MGIDHGSVFHMVFNRFNALYSARLSAIHFKKLF